MPEQPLVLVGEVIKPHGLTGEFSVKAHVDSPDFFGHVSRFYLRRTPKERPRPVSLISWRMHSGRLLLHLEQVRGRDEAEALRGAELLVRFKDLPRQSDEEIFVQELIGMAVELPCGHFLGRITSVSVNAGQEVWAIRTASENEVLFPAHPTFVLEVDRTAGTIRIDPPPGLLELYLGEEG